MYTGLMNTNGQFEEGQTPWNKGKAFLAGKNNPMYGKRHSEETKRKIRETKARRKSLYKVKSGNAHWNWRGDAVGYFGVHHWLHKQIKPTVCQQCGNDPGFTRAGHTKLQWANISHTYRRDINDWKVLCISCHWKFDKRINNFRKGGQNGK